jgi:rhamnosyltransferase
LNRILFFVHYNKYSNLSGHVLYLLEHIKHIFTQIIFISNSPLADDLRTKLTGLCDEIICRDNRGFDFGAWKDAVLSKGWEKLSQYGSLTLMNDSCFGPLFDLDSIYKKFELQEVDFWGLTNHRNTDHGIPGKHKLVPDHIQSYFMCFNNNVIQSPVFHDFWRKTAYEADIEYVIQKYETQLTKTLARAGFIYTTFFDGSSFQDSEPNLLIKHPDLCINNHVPFVKIKAFVYFPIPKYIIKLIQEKTNYPVSLIYDYFTEMYDPNTTLFINNKLIPASLNNDIPSSALKIAVHLHVYYIDVFEKYILYFDNFSFDFDLFITTDTFDKKSRIEMYLQNHGSGKKIKEIVITENRGRDILPWLSMADRLGNYDIVGHFHTKKCLYMQEWFGVAWQQELFDLLLLPSAKIINAFSSNKKIGIVIPEIPYFYHIHVPLQFSQETQMQIAMNDLWKKMLCKKDIDFKKLLTAIMPCGTMFWYRPAALRPLFQLNLSRDSIPEEPVPVSGTILHCIERILVYIAWNEGYDYRIMVPETPLESRFAGNMPLNQYCLKYNKIEQSITFRIGRFILFIPRSLMVLFRKFVKIGG